MAEPFLGEIRMFGGDFAPRGWARCHGQLLPISDHAPLFSLIGTTYGGDGIDTFALPDLREYAAPAAPLPITFIIALAGVYPSRP
jgi:microcystin-dependent protein